MPLELQILQVGPPGSLPMPDAEAAYAPLPTRRSEASCYRGGCFWSTQVLPSGSPEPNSNLAGLRAAPDEPLPSGLHIADDDL